MTRHLIAALMFGLALMAANAASAGPFEDGEAAYQRDDYATAWKRLADKGDAKAQHTLGHIYGSGIGGVAQDYKEAVKWYRLAADQGYADAQFSLGLMYAKGHGVAQDYKEAAKWYRLVAAQGDARAQHIVGAMYESGLGVAEDYKEAVKWYRLAADQGYADAQSYLGLMYANGRGVAQDYTRAHMWFNLAASSLTGDDGKRASTNRDNIAKKMTPADISKAQDIARKCQASNFQQCD